MAKEQPEKQSPKQSSAERSSSSSRPSASKAAERRAGDRSNKSKLSKEGKERRLAEQRAKEGAEDWVMFDARDLVVGRLASEIARCLRGKDNPAFQPHQDSGRHVLVVNTDHLHFTGNKRQQKLYYRHTGYPGGIKSRSVKELFEKDRSTDILRNAVKGMLPRGVLGRTQLRKLRLYGGEAHRQGAQQPTMIDFAASSAKNSKR